MELRPLGRTDIKVTSVCLGTMTWGQQNTEVEAHEQLDYAIGEGINFIDTAEMYPVPSREETQGRTESYIGSWMRSRKNRDKVIIATKVFGRSDVSWRRDCADDVRHTSDQIDEALGKSLKRLGTDCVDLYQLHWPDRAIPGFGFHSYHDYDADDMVPLEDILETLARHVEKGNIRHIGLSNESAWGTMKFLEIAKARSWPRMVTNQCAFSLVNRRFDLSAAEIAMREQVGLLAYSPLAQGYLTGKYRHSVPENSRKAAFGGFLKRYEGPGAIDAVNDCLDAAAELGITPTQFALKFVETREFVTSNIIGATSLAQLKENIDAHKITWTKEMEKAAHRLNKAHRSPCP